jgi:hypothetical protein
MILSDPTAQHAVSIAMIAGFGVVSLSSVLYPLYKRNKLGLDWFSKRSRLRRALRKHGAAELASEEVPDDSATDKIGIVAGKIDELTAMTKAAIEKASQDSETLRKQNETLEEKLGEVNQSVSNVKTQLNDVKTQLDSAGRQAVVWNTVSLLCGLFGVAVGIVTL